MKETNAHFGATDELIIPEGLFKANLVKLEKNRGKNNHIVYNLTYRISPASAKIILPCMKYENGVPVIVKNDVTGNEMLLPCDYVVGKEIRQQGVWLNPSPAPNEQWQNKEYKELLQSLGYELKEVETSSGKVKVLPEADENEPELLGRPCLINVNYRTFTGKDGLTHYSVNIAGVLPWIEGERIEVVTEKPTTGEEPPF